MAVEKLKWGQWYYDSISDYTFRYCPLHVGQRAIWESEKKINWLLCGVLAGKTSFALLMLMREILKYPGESFLCTAPTVPILEQALIPEAKKVFNKYNPLGSWDECFKKDRLHLKNGATVFFRPLSGGDDSSDRIQGIHPRFVVCDEVAMLESKAWDGLRTRITGECKLLCTSTPYRNREWVQKFVDSPNTEYFRPNVYPYTNEIRRLSDGDTLVVQGPSTMNPSFSPDEFDSIRATTDKQTFSLYYLGAFATASEGLIYPTLHTCFIKPQPIPRGTLFACTDPGLSAGRSPTATIIAVLDTEGTLWVIKEFYFRPQPGKSSTDSVFELRKFHNDLLLNGKNPVACWWADCNCDYATQLANCRISDDDHFPAIHTRPYKKVQGSVYSGINDLTQRIGNGKLKIFDTCQALAWEANRYQWDKKKQIPSGPCHTLDALRYMNTEIKHRGLRAYKY